MRLLAFIFLSLFREEGTTEIKLFYKLSIYTSTNFMMFSGILPILLLKSLISRSLMHFVRFYENSVRKFYPRLSYYKFIKFYIEAGKDLILLCHKFILVKDWHYPNSYARIDILLYYKLSYCNFFSIFILSGIVSM